MEKKTFLNTWKDIPSTNEIQFTIENVECTSDGIQTKMAQNNVSLQHDGDFDLILSISGVYCGQENSRGPGHDLPVDEVDQRDLGTDGDQTRSRQPQHHPLLQVSSDGGEKANSQHLTNTCILLKVAQPIFQVYDAILHN